MPNTLKNSLQRYIRHEEQVIFRLFILVFIAAYSYQLINALTTHYTGNAYAPLTTLFLLPYFLSLVGIGLYCQTWQFPQTGAFFRCAGFTLLAITACGSMATGIQFTPFTTIDTPLTIIDHWLHLNTVPIVNWTAQYPRLFYTLNFIYNFLLWETGALPLVLTALGYHRAFNQYLCAWLISWLIGSTIYYFFPTIGPAALFHTNYFAPSQYATVLKFNEIHQHLPVTTMHGGLIVFPSFHVIWACLATAAFSQRWYYWIPAAGINGMVILSTVLLGRHYAIDVIAGISISVLAIALSRWLLRPSTITTPEKQLASYQPALVPHIAD